MKEPANYWVPGKRFTHYGLDWICVEAKDIPAHYWDTYTRAWEVGNYLKPEKVWHRGSELPEGDYSWAGLRGGTTRNNYRQDRNISVVLPTSFIEPEFNEHGEVAP